MLKILKKIGAKLKYVWTKYALTPKKKVNYYYFKGFYFKKFFFKVDANLDLTELFDCYNNNEKADDYVQEIVEQDEEIEWNRNRIYHMSNINFSKNIFWISNFDLKSFSS